MFFWTWWLSNVFGPFQYNCLWLDKNTLAMSIGIKECQWRPIKEEAGMAEDIVCLIDYIKHQCSFEHSLQMAVENLNQF